MPKDSEGASGLSRWELALYIGIPVAALCAAGCAYLYLRRKEESKDTEEEVVEKSASDLADTSINGSENVSSPVEKTPEELAQAAKLRGNKYFKGGKFESAIQCYEEAINICPPDKVNEIATFYQNKAAANERLQNWQEVIDDTTKAIELMPKYVKAIARRAKAYENIGKKIECLEDVTAVCLLEGFQNTEFIMMADKILKAVGKELATERMKQRKPTLPSGFFIKSYLDSFCTDVFSVNLEDGSEEQEKTAYVSALDHVSKKEFGPVADLCTDEINADGIFKVQAYLLRGTMYTLMSKVDDAMADLQYVINAGDDDKYTKLISNALIKKASLHMQTAKVNECFDDFKQAAAIDKDNADVYHHRGQVYFLAEDLDKAKSDFEKSIQLNDAFVHPRLQLGYCLSKIAMKFYSAGMMQDANKIMEETVEKFPKSSEAWSLYGQMLQEQQQFQLSEEKLDKAIDLQPDNPTTFVYKALLYLQWKKDFALADKLIRKAIELDDTCDFAYETLATLQVQKGNTEEATELFNKAIDLARTEAEMAQSFSLLEAAKAQSKVTKRLGISLPSTDIF